MPKHIAKLEMRNFQTHEDTTLEFHPGVNILTGQNRSGKSAVFRALRLLIYNQPRDVNQWIRHGKSTLFVRVTMADGTWVAREKGKDINRYVVMNPAVSPEPIVLDSVGTNVPPEVFGVVGIGLATLAKDHNVELNMSRQFDEAFMLSQSDPNIARWINSLTGLDDIRAAIDSLTYDFNNDGKRHKAHVKRVAELDAELAHYAALDEIVADLDALATDDAAIAVERDTLRRLEELAEEMRGLRKQALPLREEIAVLEECVGAISEEEVEALREVLVTLRGLETLAAEMATVETELVSAGDVNQKILMLSKMDFDSLREEFVATERLSQLGDQMAAMKTKLEEAVASVATAKDDLRAVDEEIGRLRTEMFAGEDGNYCPLCGGEVGDDVIEHIMMEAGNGQQ